MKKRFNELFKSRKFIFLFSAVVNLIVILVFKFGFNSLNNHNDLVVLPVLGMLFGPYAILGCLIVQIGYWITNYSLYNIDIILLNLFAIFISCSVLWKMWYASFNNQGYDTPNLNSSYNYLKFFVIYLVYYIVSYCLFSFDARLNWTDVIYVDFVLNCILSVLITIIMIFLCNYFKIHMYSPKIQFKQILPMKAYSVILALAVILGCLFYAKILNFNLFAIMVVLSIVYLFKPYSPEVFEIKENFDINIVSKLIYSLFLVLFMAVFIIILFATGLLAYDNQLDIDVLILQLSDSLLKLTISFVFPVYFYMYVLERNVTTPINKISRTLSGEVNSSNDYYKIRDTLNSISTNNEIKTLSDSLVDMERDLMEYGEDLVKVTADKERFKTELELADSIQSSMIPTDFNDFCEGKNFKISGFMKPAREVGGDFYDYFQIDDDNIGFVIGDVSGKGISAALVMVKAMTLIQDYAKYYKDVSECFSDVNNLLCEGNVEELFVTCWLGKLNVKTGELSFVNAGHNPPLIKNNASEFEYMEFKPGLVLAGMEDMPYREYKIQLNPGDMLFLYTDGITEANDNYRGFYGEDRLKDVLNRCIDDDVGDIISSVESDVNEFCNNQEQFDDTTMFIIRYDG